MPNMLSTLVTFLVVCLANTHAGLLSAVQFGNPTYFQELTTTVHNGPTAISHQSLTRVLSKPAAHGGPFPQQLPTSPADPLVTGTISAAAKPITPSHHTAIVRTLSHTPAHLTYAAAPIVFQMLPLVKAAQSNSHDTSVGSNPARSYNYAPQ